MVAKISSVVSYLTQELLLNTAVCFTQSRPLRPLYVTKEPVDEHNSIEYVYVLATHLDLLFVC